MWGRAGESPADVPPRVRLSGMGRTRASSTARLLLDEGSDVLLSFGYCGGLDPGLRPGDLVLPERVIDAESGTELVTDRAWNRRFTRLLSATGLRVTDRARTVVSSPGVVGRDTKRAWDGRWPAAAVDMESYAVVEEARRRGVPVAVLRAVLDTQRMEIPHALGALLDPWGRRTAGPFGTLAAAVSVSPATLVVLARARRQARKSLGAAARALGALASEHDV